MLELLLEPQRLEECQRQGQGLSRRTLIRKIVEVSDDERDEDWKNFLMPRGWTDEQLE